MSAKATNLAAWTELLSAPYPLPTWPEWEMIGAPARDGTRLCGHVNTVPDVIGRLDGQASLTIFTEGNHFPALLPLVFSGFPQWAASRRLDLDPAHIIAVTLPQRMILETLESGQLALGNLVLAVGRDQPLLPDLVMGSAAGLQRLYRKGFLHEEAFLIARNRGIGLLVRAGNPLGLAGLSSLSELEAGIVTVSPAESAARELYLRTIDGLLGEEPSKRIMKREVMSFPGRVGIQHRDVPFAVARNYAAVGIIFYHLALYYAASNPGIFSALPVENSDQFGSEMYVARMKEARNEQGARAFLDYFLSAAATHYPEHGFVRLAKEEIGKRISLAVG